MNWLQNFIIVVISFLLARLMIDSNYHHRMVDLFLARSRRNISGLVTGILVLSYLLSLIFPNTIVVLAMYPVIKYILVRIPKTEPKRLIATTLALALIFGANIGGMGSLIGTSLNIMLLSFLEIYRVGGREHVTFFSWYLYGVPATAILLLLGRLVLVPFEKKITLEAADFPESHDLDGSRFRSYLFYFFLNISFMFSLTAAEFFFHPNPIYSNLSVIDIVLIMYFVVFILAVFIIPREGFNTIQALKNLLFLFLFFLLIPLIFIIESSKEMSRRLALRTERRIRIMDYYVLSAVNVVWQALFKVRLPNLQHANPSAYISINRMIYDLPYSGILFMGIILVFIFIIFKIGDDPATMRLDGYLNVFIESYSGKSLHSVHHPFLMFFIIIFSTIFITEFINNTATVLILYPAIINITNGFPGSPLLLMLATTIAATGAFMTPIASPVNAIAYAGIPGVSLKRMILLGFFFNMVSGIYLVLFFYIFSKFYTA